MIERISVTTSDGPMPATLARPDAPRGAVVVVQEAFGVTDHIEDVCARFAAADWLAIAPALFHRQGAPAFAYDDLESVLPVVTQLTRDTIDMDVRAAITALEGEGFETRRCGIVGFCMGGSVALFAATAHDLGASVTFYGGGVAKGRFGVPPLIEIAPSLRAPWLGLFGDRDKGIPVEDVERLREAAATASVPTEIVRYPEADHGFHCDDRPSVFHPDAAADAWQRTLDWFDRHIPQIDR
jgi:carboxymethylenebutenolidase